MDRRAAQRAELTWRGAVPVSLRYDDPYFSLADGLAEADHVFLAGNGLPERFRPGFRVAELGFGSGLNALAAARAWSARSLPGVLCLTSFEAAPLAPADMARALARWPELAPWSVPLIAAWERGEREIALPGLALTVIEGDARTVLPRWTGTADAWFLGGFGPARSRELWEAPFLAEVARHTRGGGTCATHSAAGAVRAALGAAGFAVARTAGFGGRRRMTCGILAP
jgi:tRNA U34 5-methylaminomethyl-2-thiouridine-forming methyltransferase MnmC